MYYIIVDGPTHADRIAVLKSLNLYQPPKPRKKKPKNKSSPSVSGDECSLSDDDKNATSKEPPSNKSKKRKKDNNGSYYYHIYIAVTIMYLFYRWTAIKETKAA